MVELISTVRKYGTNRRHIEIPKQYFNDLELEATVVILDKKTYDAIHKKLIESSKKEN
jgi:glycerol dehydrogenase-like iron-containing ADH family enzyme